MTSMTPMTLQGFANECCAFLPPGWQVVITCELGCGDVQLIDPKGDTLTVDEFAGSFEDRCKCAINMARRCEGLDLLDWSETAKDYP